MEILERSAASACFLGIIFSVMSGMMPSDKLSKQMNVIFSLILLILTVSPFLTEEMRSDPVMLPDHNLDDYAYIYNSGINRQITANISDSLGEYLSGKGISPVKITVDINNSADGSISINQAEIIIRRGSNISLTRRLAAEALGVGENLINVKTED